LPPSVESRARAGEGERDEQPPHGEDRAIDRSDSFSPILRLIGQYEPSAKKYPNITAGEDFKGYPKQ